MFSFGCVLGDDRFPPARERPDPRHRGFGLSVTAMAPAEWPIVAASWLRLPARASYLSPHISPLIHRTGLQEAFVVAGCSVVRERHIRIQTNLAG